MFVFFKTCQLDTFYFSSHGTIQSGISKIDWILDAGATGHMVHSTSFFTTLRSVINTYVKLPNMYYLYLLLPLTDKKSVSSFAFNLISFSKLTWSLNCCFIFISDLYSVQDLLL